MSLGQELKDFASGFRSSRESRYRQKQMDYLDERMKREKDSNFDFNAALKDETGEPDDENNGFLYNLGKWTGLNDIFGTTKPKSAVPAASAVDTTQQAQALPLDAYSSANSIAAATTPVTSSISDEDEDDNFIPAYAEGGMVQPAEEEEAVSLDPATAPVSLPAKPMPVETAALPELETPAASAVPVDAAPAAPAAPESPEDDGVSAKQSLGRALDGGIKALTAQFNLNPDGGAVPDEQGVKTGQQALMSGAGRATPSDMKAVFAAVDPEGKLNHSQAVLRAMTKGYEFYMERGQPAKANNYAAMIIQYSTYQASKHGMDALDALKKGDVQSAAHSLAAGYSNIPDGKEATDVKVSPDGKSVTVSEMDVTNGKKGKEHTLSGEQLYQAAIGLANKSATWQSIMSAAAAAKGVNLPPSEAYTNAQLKLNGLNPDGSPITDAGNEAVPVDGAQPAQGQTQAAAPPGDYAAMMSARESANNPSARNGDSVGQYQIQSAAWRDITGHDPVVNGVDERLDPQKNAQVFKALTQRNGQAFQQKFNRAPSPGELALMHQQGAAGGMALLSANPNSPAVDALRAIGVANPAAHLAQNGIPENATAGQAVQAIQNFYTKSARPPAQPQRPGAAPAQSRNPMALQDALPEDVPEAPEMPVRPTAPKILRADPRDMADMSPTERTAYIKQVGQANIANRAKFQQDMQAYNAAVKAAKKPTVQDPNKLAVKDRGDALAALDKAKTELAEDKTSRVGQAFASFPVEAQRAVDNLAYGLYTHNDTTPARAYQAAANMMVVNPNNRAQMNFTPHKMPDGNVRIVFRTGDKMVIPKNAFDELAAARGNQMYLARTTVEEEQRKAAERKQLIDKGTKAVKATGRVLLKLGPQNVEEADAMLRALQ